MKEQLNEQILQALNNVVLGLESNPENRPEQINMAQTIRRYYNHVGNNPGHVLLAEAGTGVGKSFAYLTAICETVKSVQETVVISTNTLSLQEQLCNKDIPMVLKYYPELTCEKAKGRNNYVCLNKMDQVLSDLFTEEDTQKFLDKIKDWLKTNETGECSDIPFSYTKSQWSEINADTSTCLGEHCPSKGKCYVNRARMRLEKADIIVTNHAMVLSDYQKKVLPSYEKLVIDEGHNFEAAALNIFTEKVSKYDIYKLQQRLNVSVLQAAYARAKVKEIIDKAKDTLILYSSTFFSSLEEKTYQKEELADAMNMIVILKEIAKASEKSMADNDVEYIKMELDKTLEFVNDIASKIETWTLQNEDNMVYWSENNEICYCPLDIANQLKQFWATKNTVITSATLTVNKSYNSLKQTLGLNGQCWGLRLDSPFNYRENAVVYCPSNAPLPNTKQYTQYLCRTIKDVIKKIPGKVFVLFTSYAVMRDCHAELSNDTNHIWLLQGTSSKELLLQEYRKNNNSILFGTNTFWEGVDEVINCVIITKLPFEVPTTPIKKAQYDLVKSHGRNPFMDLSLPRCALKLKQGAGRLIRNSTHRGAVVICDPRIKKPWGRIIINTLPDMYWTEDLNAIDAYINKAV